MDETTCTGLESEEFFQDFYFLSYLGTETLEKVETHKHGFYEIIFYINGDVEYIVDNSPYVPYYGDILMIAPTTVHEAKIAKDSEPYRRYVLWITKDFIQSLVAYDPSMINLFYPLNTNDFHHMRFEEKKMNEIIHLLAEISECQYAKEFSYLTKCKSILYTIFHELNFTKYQNEYYKSNFQKKDVYLKITDYIKQNLKGDLSLDILADEFYMSKYHMLHIFKEKMGISIHKYIIIRRLEYGKFLILSGESISKVHTLCGFKDYATFYRAFVKRNGMSPKEYYKTHKQNSIF